MRTIFFGTPEIAVPALDALVKIAEVVGVVCQPDRPAGRGMKLREPAVKLRAQELGLSVFQPEKVKDGRLSQWMRELEADVGLVIAYGRILGSDVLLAPRLGCVNLHASLLPKYRGAAPIERAIMAGEKETGVCLMKMDEGMDTGDILCCHRLELSDVETAGTLRARLGQLAAEVTSQELPRYLGGKLTPSPQDEGSATHAPPLTKADLQLDFGKSRESIERTVRGLAPQPGAATFHTKKDGKQKRIKLLAVARAHSPLDASHALDAGEVFAEEGVILVGTNDGPLQILSAQLEGKRVQSSRELLNGRALVSGDRLGS